MVDIVVAKIGPTQIVILLPVAALAGGAIYCTGAVDYIPRVRAYATSPDGELKVAVYQRRLFPRPFFPRMGAFATVSDKQGNVLYERNIFSDDDWDDTVGTAFTQIVFEDDEIRIGPGAYDPKAYHVISLTELSHARLYK